MVHVIDETQLVDLLEALYALERDDSDWLAGAIAELARVCGGDQHYIGFFYDASNVRDFKLYNPCAHNAGPEVLASFETFRSLTTPDFVAATFRSLHMGSARRTASTHLERLLRERQETGWGDIFNINGLDPSGIGCILTIGCREPEFELDPKTANVFRRIATHLGAAFRCRRRLAELTRVEAPAEAVCLSSGAEAILDTSFRIVHAEGEAKNKTARERIQNAAAAIDAVRAPPMRNHGTLALDSWHPLTSARWTIVERFEENGRRYIIARENQVSAEGFDRLTNRERQVVVHAALGFSNKQIAYVLGISDATVRVLMARAASRFGVRTRKQLLEHPALSCVTASNPSLAQGRLPASPRAARRPQTKPSDSH